MFCLEIPHYKRAFHKAENGYQLIVSDDTAGMEHPTGMWTQARPFIAVILQQFITAGMVIISKFALNQGLNQHVLVVYRYAIATVVVAPLALVFERSLFFLLSPLYLSLREFC